MYYYFNVFPIFLSFIIYNNIVCSNGGNGLVKIEAITWVYCSSKEDVQILKKNVWLDSSQVGQGVNF